MGDALSHADEYLRNPPPEQLLVGGLYEHFKGGKYVVIAVPKHHHDSLAMGRVTYLQIETGDTYRREVSGVDGFISSVPHPTNPKVQVPRFRLVGTAVVTISEHGYSVIINREA